MCAWSHVRRWEVPTGVTVMSEGAILPVSKTCWCSGLPYYWYLPTLLVSTYPIVGIYLPYCWYLPCIVHLQLIDAIVIVILQWFLLHKSLQQGHGAAISVHFESLFSVSASTVSLWCMTKHHHS